MPEYYWEFDAIREYGCCIHMLNWAIDEYMIAINTSSKSIMMKFINEYMSMLNVLP